MRWLLQENLYSEEGWDALVGAMKRLEFDYSVHKVIPFSNGELHPDPGLPDKANAIVMGSYTMAKYAHQRDWRPGSFLHGLDFRQQFIQWGDRMLNADANICTFEHVPFQREPFFLRPVHDTKAFTGLVLDWDEFSKWRDGLLRVAETADPVNDPLGVSMLTPQTPVMVCRKKTIYSETRCWVVPSRGRIRKRWSTPGIFGSYAYQTTVVTTSGYKSGKTKRYSRPEDTDPRIIRFVDRLVEDWYPNEAFVVDVAITPEDDDNDYRDLKVVEVNNLNSAGFYKGDVVKLAVALEEEFGDLPAANLAEIPGGV